ncbi:MAG TPA: VOC family protein [Noviherbaspirillum sp.]|jgi:catechol 2,3-dioxygenase-like lactoylglutathione lyase family enzyme|uniref:VOC family protein n=1 Tax=Noviherbaspirillum sp. TaxID=1926288 RepID=UPI002DDCDE59|nr:VOC family protein [Noviherbaspirillum sp.]HEV2611985.1 VOC family protein [Noviherbaspirillum sp.]
MIDHTGIRVSDLSLSKAFYCKTLGALGYKVCLEVSGAVSFGAQQSSHDDPGGDFWLFQGEPYAPRTHIAFRAMSEEQVDCFFRQAISAGGKDNGQPGLRPHYHKRYYAAYILDPDGYNIEAVFHQGRPGEAI